MDGFLSRFRSVLQRVKTTVSASRARQPKRDPWYSAAVEQRSRRRRHPNQDLIDAIDDAQRGPRWLPRTRGWLDR